MKSFERSIVNRIILLVVGFMFALCATWGASKIRSFGGELLSLILVVLGVVALFLSFLNWMDTIVSLGLLPTGARIEKIEKESEFSSVYDALTWMISAFFLFGAIVAPIGRGLCAWVTPWDFLLIVGVIPVCFSVNDLVEDIAATRLSLA